LALRCGALPLVVGIAALVGWLPTRAEVFVFRGIANIDLGALFLILWVALAIDYFSSRSNSELRSRQSPVPQPACAKSLFAGPALSALL
jgi:hypothetical protein